MNTSFPFFLIIYIMIAQQFIAQEVYNLWDKGEKPFYKENNLIEYEKESFGVMCAFDITKPTLTVYKAEGNYSNTAVVIIPGGGYSTVAIYHEGHDLAKVLAKNGITSAVLKYRLPNPKSSDLPHLVPLTDTRRAINILRKNFKKYDIDVDKVGVLGFSAGSHLATIVSLWKSKNIEENPNFSALIYGVTNLSQDNIKWLEESLYYGKMTEDELEKNRLLELVSEETPPSFLVHAYDDEICNVNESTLYAQKLYEHKVPVEIHVFTSGGHGFGMGRKKDGTDQWVQLFINWLNNNFN